MKMIGMGDYYFIDNNTLVKVVCKAKDVTNHKTIICYSEIANGGYSTPLKCMDEDSFRQYVNI